MSISQRHFRLYATSSSPRSCQSNDRGATMGLLSSQGGFTYLMVMFFVVIIGISLMVIGQQWSVTTKRDREAELLFRGTRIKEAIERYAAAYEVQKAKRPNRYPLKLKDLTEKPNRYLQKVYLDPMTGKDFQLIKVNTEIHGVQSTSEDKPFDQVNFKGAATYSAIRFEAKAQSSGNCNIGSLEGKLGCTPSKMTDIDPKTGKPLDAPADEDSGSPLQETPQ